MTEGELTSRFDRLLGRAPDDQEKRLLLHLQKELGIADEDGMWLILVILSHYEHLYRQVPDQIEAAASFAVERAKARLAAETEAEQKRIHGALAAAVLDTIQETATDRVKTERRRATALMSGLSTMLLLVVGIGSYSWGFDQGEISSNSAQFWAASEQGQYARRLEEYGIVTMLRSCHASDGDFRITRDRTVICETRARQVHSMGPLPTRALGAE